MRAERLGVAADEGPALEGTEPELPAPPLGTALPRIASYIKSALSTRSPGLS